jgi:hypothetical protein
MPLKLNVGLSRKVGEANYGSRGGSVNVELELDVSLASEPDKLREKIRQLYGLVRTSLDEELNGHADPANTGHPNPPPQSNGNGAPYRNGTPKGNPRRPATQSQIKAIYAIARNRRFDLEPYLKRQFQVGRPEDLNIKEASNVIDSLKSNAA